MSKNPKIPHEILELLRSLVPEQRTPIHHEFLEYVSTTNAWCRTEEDVLQVNLNNPDENVRNRALSMLLTKYLQEGELDKVEGLLQHGDTYVKRESCGVLILHCLEEGDLTRVDMLLNHEDKDVRERAVIDYVYDYGEKKLLKCWDTPLKREWFQIQTL
jgi:hypothetical protein